MVLAIGCGQSAARITDGQNKRKERMQAREVTDEIAVSPEIAVEDVSDIAAAGYRSIICNRPDGETIGQARFEEIEAAAREAGLEIVWQPVPSGQVMDEDGRQFAELVADLPKPVYAYCRSGTRCIVLWSLGEAARGAREPADIVRRAGEVGYDLRALMPRLEALKAATDAK